MSVSPASVREARSRTPPTQTGLLTPYRERWPPPTSETHTTTVKHAVLYKRAEMHMNRSFTYLIFLMAGIRK